MQQLQFVCTLRHGHTFTVAAAEGVVAIKMATATAEISHDDAFSMRGQSKPVPVANQTASLAREHDSSYIEAQAYKRGFHIPCPDCTTRKCHILLCRYNKNNGAPLFFALNFHDPANCSSAPTCM